MPDEQPTELVAKIVAAYVRRNQVQPDQLAVLILTVHQALGGLGKARNRTRRRANTRSSDPAIRSP
jgi:predicted transcriptional regulator